MKSKPDPSIPRLEIVHEALVPPLPEGKVLRSSAEVAEVLRPRIGGFGQEVFAILLLDAKHKIKRDGFRVVSVGSLTASISHPREIFWHAVHERAAAIIAGHNHPSSDVTPSAEDVDLTKRLRECGELLGIRLLDHCIVGADTHFSFADGGYWS